MEEFKLLLTEWERVHDVDSDVLQIMWLYCAYDGGCRWT